MLTDRFLSTGRCRGIPRGSAPPQPPQRRDAAAADGPRTHGALYYDHREHHYDGGPHLERASAPLTKPQYGCSQSSRSSLIAEEGLVLDDLGINSYRGLGCAQPGKYLRLGIVKILPTTKSSKKIQF